MKKELFFILFLAISAFIFLMGSHDVYALDCGSCDVIVGNEWCDGAGQVTCTGPNPPAWTRAETKCCRGDQVVCIVNPNGECPYYSPDDCLTCYTSYTYYQCTSDCFSADCCQGGQIIAGHCETALGANPACWFGGKYKTCCKNDGSGQEAACSVGGSCPSQYGQNLCPSGYSITAPGVTTCTAGPTATPVPGGPTATSAPPPPGGSSVSLTCPASIIKGSGGTLTVGQYPANGDDSACYYNPLDVSVVSGPQGGVVCQAGGVGVVCPGPEVCFDRWRREKTRTWNTSSWQAGSYRLEVYYGGHSDCPGCCDTASRANCNVTVVAPTSTPTPSCITGSWETTCGYAGSNWCAAGTSSCDSGWVDGPSVFVACPSISRLTNTGTYCTRWDGKVKFTGSISSCIASCGNGCNAPCCSGLSFSPGSVVAGGTITFSYNATNAPNGYLYYRRSGGAGWIGPVGVLFNSFTAPSQAGTYEAVYNAYNSSCNAFCNSDGRFFTANACPATSFNPISSGCGGCWGNFTVLAPSPSPTLPPGVTPICTPAVVPPDFQALNNYTFENAIDFSWSLDGNTETQFRRIEGINCDGGVTDTCPAFSPRTESVVTDDTDHWICVQVRGKNYAGSGNCDNCTSNSPPNCCVSDWSDRKRCAFCKHPSDPIQLTPILCSANIGGQAVTWNGTRITWIDNSSVESGFVLYRCPKGSCPTSTRDYFAKVGANISAYDDCTYGFPNENYTYAVRCFYESPTCGQIPPPITPLPITPTPFGSPTPTPTTPPSCPLCPTPVQLTPVLRADSKYNVNLTWTDVNSGARQESGYKIYRCLGANCAKPASALTTLSANATSYTDTNNNAGFDCGTSLSYWIVPTKIGCVEPICTRNDTTTPACAGCVSTCPSSPSLVSPASGFGASSDSVVLQWSAPSSWGIVCPPGVQNNYYILYVSTTNNGNPAGTLKAASGLLPGFSPNGMNMGLNTSYTLNNLEENKWYYWQVRAENK